MTAILDTNDANQATGHHVVIEAPKAVTGRPSTYCPQKARTIIEHLSEGTPLREICRMEGMPAWRNIYNWMDNNPELLTAIARARVMGFDAIAQQTLEIADNSTPETVQVDRLRVDTRLKLLSKWDPKRYGDKLDIGNADGQPFQINIK